MKTLQIIASLQQQPYVWGIKAIKSVYDIMCMTLLLERERETDRERDSDRHVEREETETKRNSERERESEAGRVTHWSSLTHYPNNQYTNTTDNEERRHTN